MSKTHSDFVSPEELAQIKKNGAQVCFTRDEAAGMAIRVEDVMGIMASLLDGAEANTRHDDYKRRTLIIMARDRARHLQYVADRLRGGVPPL